MDQIVKKPDGTTTVRLINPVRADIRARDGSTSEEVFEEVVFRPMSFGDLKAMGNEDFNGGIDQTYWLIRRLCKLPEAAFDKIHSEDMKACMEVVQSFLPKSRKTPDQGRQA